MPIEGAIRQRRSARGRYERRNSVEAHAFEESIDDGQGADSVRGQGPPLGTSDLTGAWGIGRTGNMAFFGFFHWCSS